MTTQLATNFADARRQLDDSGFCVLADALPSEQVKTLRRRLVTQAEYEKKLGHAFEDGGPKQQWGEFIDDDGNTRTQAFSEASGGVNQRLWMLVNKGQPFIDLLDHKVVMSLITYLLGENFLLSSHTANIAKPGGVQMPLHTDQWWMPQPIRSGRRHLPVGSITRTRFDPEDSTSVSSNTSTDIGVLSAPACGNVIWMLDDFTVENGATRVVPASHLIGRHPRPEDEQKANAIQVCAPAGSALITDGRVWHGTGANTGTSNRNAVLTTFCGPQFRPQENFVAGTRKEVLDAASPQLLALLGFKVWWGYGRTGHPTVDIIDRDQAPLGILGED